MIRILLAVRAATIAVRPVVDEVVTDMSIKEFAKRKKQLELELTALVKAFEQDSGVPVDELDYETEFPPKLGKHNKQVTVHISLNKLLGE